MRKLQYKKAAGTVPLWYRPREKITSPPVTAETALKQTKRDARSFADRGKGETPRRIQVSVRQKWHPYGKKPSEQSEGLFLIAFGLSFQYNHFRGLIDGHMENLNSKPARQIKSKLKQFERSDLHGKRGIRKTKI